MHFFLPATEDINDFTVNPTEDPQTYEYTFEVPIVFDTLSAVRISEGTITSASLCIGGQNAGCIQITPDSTGVVFQTGSCGVPVLNNCIPLLVVPYHVVKLSLFVRGGNSGRLRLYGKLMGNSIRSGVQGRVDYFYPDAGLRFTVGTGYVLPCEGYPQQGLDLYSCGDGNPCVITFPYELYTPDDTEDYNRPEIHVDPDGCIKHVYTMNQFQMVEYSNESGFLHREGGLPAFELTYTDPHGQVYTLVEQFWVDGDNRETKTVYAVGAEDGTARLESDLIHNSMDYILSVMGHLHKEIENHEALHRPIASEDS